MVDDGAADADAGIAGECRAFAKRVVLRCRDQSEVTDLDQILDFDRRAHPAMHVPCDLAHELHMAGDQLFDIGFLFQILVAHIHVPAAMTSLSAKKRMPPWLFAGVSRMAFEIFMKAWFSGSSAGSMLTGLRCTTDLRMRSDSGR